MFLEVLVKVFIFDCEIREKIPPVEEIEVQSMGNSCGRKSCSACAAKSAQ